MVGRVHFLLWWPIFRGYRSFREGMTFLFAKYWFNIVFFFQIASLSMFNVVQHSYEHCFVSLDLCRFCGSFPTSTVPLLGKKNVWANIPSDFRSPLVLPRPWMDLRPQHPTANPERKGTTPTTPSPKELGVRKLAMKRIFNTSASAHPSNVSHNMLFDKSLELMRTERLRNRWNQWINRN